MKRTCQTLVFGLWAGCLVAADYIPSHVVEQGPAADRRQALETAWMPQPQHQIVIDSQSARGKWAIFVFIAIPTSGRPFTSSLIRSTSQA